MDNREYNKNLDDELKKGIVSTETIKAFESAYDYAAASTIGWLVKKLGILTQAINEGREIKIETESTAIRDPKALKEWMTDKYPDIIEDLYQNKN